MLLQQTGPTVKVFMAGDHFSGMEKEKPTESQELVEALLNRSGYTKGYEWECRVDKQRHCSTESRPIRVVGYKSYGVIMRVKPYVHSNYDYQMTLYVPQGSGYSAKNLFEQLKSNEKSISRTFRQQEHKEKKEPMEAVAIPPAPVISLPAKIETPVIKDSYSEYRPEFKTLQGIVKNTDKLRYVLQKIKTVNSLNFCHNKLQFTEALKHECKWDKEGHAKVAVGRVLSELVKSDYLMETVNERDKIIGYSLTQKGLVYIAKHQDDPPIPTTPKREIAKIDVAGTLINMRDKLQELADVAKRIASNNAEKAELQRKIVLLDDENENLTQVIGNNKECQDALVKLGLLISPLPVHGAKVED